MTERPEDPAEATGPIELPWGQREATEGHDVPEETEPQDAESARLAAVEAAVTHRRVQRRQTLTFLGLFVGLFLVGLAALAFYQGRLSWPFGGSPAATSQPCPSTNSTPAPAKGTAIRVYNSTTRRGLALSVSRDLAKRGFRITETPRNDPLEAKVATAAAVRFGPNGELYARTVAAQVDGAVTMVKDDRIGMTVDLALGTAFARLRTPAEAARWLATRPRPSPTACTPTAATTS
jgi:hypothetical protein